VNAHGLLYHTEQKPKVVNTARPSKIAAEGPTLPIKYRQVEKTEGEGGRRCGIRGKKK